MRLDFNVNAHMHFESEQFDTRFVEPAGWSDHFFRYCDFRKFDTEGGEVDSVFIGCTLEDCEWYWGLFNLTIFVQVKFTRCTFRGTGFPGSKFVECEFVDCVFTKDNLGGDCYFSDVAWYKCSQRNCTGIENEFQNER